MLLRLLFSGILQSNPIAALSLVAATCAGILVAITVHEFSHGFSAYRLGDPTAKQLGRLSFNPIVHLDRVGTLMLLLAGFGWGKPVPINPAYFRIGMRQGTAIVSVAGPVSNLLTALVFAIPVRLGLLAWHPPMQYLPFARPDPGWLLADLVGYIIFFNILLAVFNLIPLAPLDGFGVAMGILPRNLANSFAGLATYGPVILLAIIGLAYFTSINLLNEILDPPISLAVRLIVGRPI